MTAPTSRRPLRSIGAILAAAALSLGGVLVAPVAAHAATQAVTSFADNGGTQFATSPNLGPLQNHGGPTSTGLTLAGGPAIDQRSTGFPRAIGGRVDAGAVETADVLPATGVELNVVIPIVGGVLLLGGIAALVVSAIRRRRVG